MKNVFPFQKVTLANACGVEQVCSGRRHLLLWRITKRAVKLVTKVRLIAGPHWLLLLMIDPVELSKTPVETEPIHNTVTSENSASRTFSALSSI